LKLTVTGRRVAVSDATREAIIRKVRRLDRVLNDSAISAQCVIAQERQQFICELTVHARGDHMLHAVARHAKLPAAVVAAVEKVGQQAHRLTDRWKSRRKPRGDSRAGALTADAPPDRTPAVDGKPRVVRARPRAVKPMSLDDAMLALTGATQSFLVFRNADSDGVAILYRRPDGDFGLIEPEG
jgi:putative sigma-54 modulation protein